MEQNKELNRLKVVLVEKKRTAKWLAQELGKDAATISKWNSNTSQPSLETLRKIGVSGFSWLVSFLLSV